MISEGSYDTDDWSNAVFRKFSFTSQKYYIKYIV